MINNRPTCVVLSLLCAGVLCSSVTASGAETFRIEDYIPQKFTDLEWRLDGRMDLTGSNRDHDELPLITINSISEESRTDQQYNRLDLNSSILYRYETVPKTLTLGSGLGISLYRNKQETVIDRIDSQGLPLNRRSESTEHTYSISWSPLIEYNTYMIGDIFAGATGNASLGYSKKPKNDSEDSEYDERLLGDYKRYEWSQYVSDGSEVGKNCAVTLTAGTGLGRLYEGQFAATALYIVDELKSVGLLGHEPSKEEMLELTEIIYQSRRAHEVDHRLAKIDALDAVMAFLADIGSISESPRMSYVLIQDVWDYFPHNSRRFGTQVKIGAGWDYYYLSRNHSRDRHRYVLAYQHHVDSAGIIDTLTNTNSIDHYSSSYRSQLDNLFIYFAANHCKPLSLKWQWDSQVELTYFLRAEGVRDRNPSSPFPDRRRSSNLIGVWGIDNYYQFNLSSYGTCILNSRTNLQLSGVFAYGRFETPIESGSDRTRTIRSWEGNIGTSLTYRLSIPTNLMISAGYQFLGDQNVYEYGPDYEYENGRSQWKLSASISHYLF